LLFASACEWGHERPRQPAVIYRLKQTECETKNKITITIPWCTCFETYRGHEFDLSRSRDVIGHVTIRDHFLLVVLWNQASICNGFRDIQM